MTCTHYGRVCHTRTPMYGGTRGDVGVCYVCNATKHLLKEIPDRENPFKRNKKTHLTSFKKYDSIDLMGLIPHPKHHNRWLGCWKSGLRLTTWRPGGAHLHCLIRFSRMSYKRLDEDEIDRTTGWGHINKLKPPVLRRPTEGSLY